VAGLAALAVLVAPSASQGAAFYAKKHPVWVELQSHGHRLLDLDISIPQSCQYEGGPVRRSTYYFSLDPRRVVRVSRKGRFRIADRQEQEGYKSTQIVAGVLHRRFVKLRYRSHTYQSEEPGAWKARECWTGHKRQGEFLASAAKRRSAGAFYIQRNRNKQIWMWVKNGKVHDATVRVRERCLKGLGAPRKRSRRWTAFYLPDELRIRTRDRRFGWQDYADHTYEVDSWSLRGRVRKRWITGKLSHTSYEHASDENYFFHMECGTGRGYDSPETKFAARRS
jgi:hypothetical protein